MAAQTRSAFQTDTSSAIHTNTSKDVTGNEVRDRINGLADSAVMKLTDMPTSVADGDIAGFNGTSGGAMKSLGTLAALLATMLTTRGDIILRGAATVARKALGASGTFLKSNGTDLVYASIAAADISDASTNGAALLTTALTPSNDDVLQRKAGAWANRTIAQLKTDLALTYADVAVREKLTANRTYYVRTDGSDSNTGLANTSGGAFLTRQKAIDTAAAIDCAGFSLTIQVGAGTYTGAAAFKDLLGASAAIIVGDETTPSNVVISRSGKCHSLDGTSTPWAIRGFQMASSGDACIYADNGARFTWQNCEFGTSLFHFDVRTGCIGTLTAAYKIIANATYHFRLSAGRMKFGNFTVTLTGTPAFTAFCYLEDASTLNINASGVTFSGAATGSRYNAQTNSVVDTNGGGASFLPGNSVGTTQTGGQYV